MPGSWSKLRDVAKLADSRAGFEFELAVGELTGLPQGITAGPTPLHVRMRFGRDQGLPAVQLALQGVVTLTCQRCLRPMQHPVDGSAHVVIVDSETTAERMSGEHETFLAADGNVSCEALAVEELLLSLPLVPRHDDERECGVTAGAAPAIEGSAADSAHGESETQRPFADLRSLLNRQRS